MRIGAVELRLNNPLVIVGSTGIMDDFVQVPLASPGRIEVPYDHVAVAARVQVAPVAVSVWRHVRPAAGSVVFNGDLYLPDGFLAIFDVENSTRFTKRVGAPGAHEVSIAVDDIDSASRIAIVIEPTSGVTALGGVAGCNLGNLVGTPQGTVTASTELGLILSEYDRPLARLACALRIIFSSANGADDRAKAITSSRIQMVVEWLRWLSPSLTLDRCQELGSLISSRLAEGARGEIGDASLSAGREVWRLLDLAI